MLFASYRRADYDDPEGFIASLGTVLNQYPDEVILHVTRPETGIQRTVKFPPTIPEIVDACNQQAEWLQKVERFKNWGKPGAQQKRLQHHEKPNPTLEELHAKYGNDYGLTGGKSVPVKEWAKAPTWGQIVEHYRARPGRVKWLAERLAVLRGEAEDTPEPG